MVGLRVGRTCRAGRRCAQRGGHGSVSCDGGTAVGTVATGGRWDVGRCSRMIQKHLLLVRSPPPAPAPREIG